MKTEIYIDFGIGYELITECSTSLVIKTENEEFVRIKKYLNGNITFWGSAFTRINTEISNDIIELPIKVNVNSITQGEFYMSLFGSINNNQKTSTFGKFTTNDLYRKLDLIKDNECKPNFYGSRYINMVNDIIVTETSITYYNVQVVSTYSDPTEYTLRYLPDGQDTAGSSELYYKLIAWYQFAFISTTDLGGGNYRHLFGTETISTFQSGFTLIPPFELAIDTSFSSDKINLPALYARPNVSSTTIFTRSIGNWLISLEASILDLLKDSGLSETTVNCNYIDLSRLFFTSFYNDLVAEQPDDITKWSLQDIFNLLKALRLAWYINSSNELTFIHPTEFITGTNYDVSAKDLHNQVYTYAVDSYPKRELINFSNSFSDDFINSNAKLEYIRNASDEITYENSKFTTDIGGTLRNADKVDKSRIMFCYADSAIDYISDVYIANGTSAFSTKLVINNRLSNTNIIYTDMVNYAYANKGYVNGTLTTLNTTIKRPMFQHNDIYLNAVLPSDLDLSDNFVTSDGDYFGFEYEYDCQTAEGILRLMK